MSFHGILRPTVMPEEPIKKNGDVRDNHPAGVPTIPPLPDINHEFRAPEDTALGLVLWEAIDR